MNSKYYFLVFALFIVLNATSFSQNYLIDQKYNGNEWYDFFKKIENDFDCRIFYLFDSVPQNTISFKEETIDLDDLMLRYQIYVSYDKNNNIFLSDKGRIKNAFSENYFSSQDEQVLKQDKSNDTFLETSNEYVEEVITVGSNGNRESKKRYNINGFISNKEDGEPVVGGTIYIRELELGSVTTPSGHYNISLPKGEYTLEISSIGRKSDKKKVKILSDGQLDIKLEQELIALDEVVVTAENYDNVKNNKLGFEKIPIKNIREVPVILGERDVLKVALMLPGIQNVGEGSSGFNVRGSPADQNLFYINNVPLYNTSHLFGFFSVFNSDAVSDFSIYKGHVPVNYGGRLASIFEVTTKNGNNQNFSARGGISPITGKILVEGPIVKNKSSYLAAFRATYSDWLLKLVRDPEIRNSNAQFQDGLVNFNFDISQKDKIKLFTYQSFDNVNLEGKTKYDYSNQGYSLRWNHILKQKHIFNLDIVHATYGYTEKNNEIEILSFSHNYNLTHQEAKFNFELNPWIQHKIIIGGNSILYRLNKGMHSPLAESSTVTQKDLGKEKGVESSFYVGDEWDITSRLSLSVGARMNYFAYLGKQNIYRYADSAPMEVGNIIDTVNYANNKIIKDYFNPDYRLALKYLLFQNTSLKASYNRLHQNIFMLTNTISISPTDKWKLSDYHIKPVAGEQISLGLYQKLFRRKVDFSIEAYIKNIRNLVEYKDGADLLVNDVLETDVLQGDLSTYGAEFSLKKNLGRFNGWVNYVYSRATVLVDGEMKENQINFGQEYPSNYEKPHSVNLVANYKVSRRLSFSSNLVYSTGRPITYPSAVYAQGELMVLHYSQRNEYRIPDYFRIDASISVEGNLLSKKLAHGSWMFSVYNLTGRKNTYSVYFRNESGVIKGYKMSIFGQPIFTITYNFKLGNYAS